MIEGKTIKFGYGTVLVGNDGCLNRVTFRHLEQEQEIGDITECKELENANVIQQVTFVYDKDFMELVSKLEKVTKEEPLVEFRGYTLDFSNYNEESVSVVQRRVLDSFVMLLGA